MALTLSFLGLGVLGALIFWLRLYWQKSARTKELAGARRKAAARDAELDQRDCLELENLLVAGTTTRRPAADGQPAARNGGAES